MEVKELLKAALVVLGPNGEHWIKGIRIGMECAITACWRASGATPLDGNTEAATAVLAAVKQLQNQIPGMEPKFVSHYNDAASTTFTDVKGLFNRAIYALEKHDT